MAALQPSADQKVDRATTTPFLLRLFYRQGSFHLPNEFSVPPPADPTVNTDYTSALPSSLRSQSLQIYTWPTCTIAELTGLLTSALPHTLPSPAVGTRLSYRLIFPDTRSTIVEGGRGRWLSKDLGSVVVGGANASLPDVDMDGTDDAPELKDSLSGDADKTLAEARFVIGDYVSCAIYPPLANGAVAPAPPPQYSGRGGREGRGSYGGPPPRENGYGGRGGYGGSFRDDGFRGRGRGGGFGAGRGDFGRDVPPGEWRRGERPPDAGYGGYGRGRGRGRGY